MHECKYTYEYGYKNRYKLLQVRVASYRISMSVSGILVLILILMGTYVYNVVQSGFLPHQYKCEWHTYTYTHTDECISTKGSRGWLLCRVRMSMSSVLILVLDTEEYMRIRR